METINKKLELLREFGLDQKQLDSLMALCFEEFMDKFEEDLQELEIVDLESIESSLSQVTLQSINEESNDSVSDLFKKVYGLNYKARTENFFIDYLDDAIKQAQATKDMIARVQNGDMSDIQNYEQDPNKDLIDQTVKQVTE